MADVELVIKIPEELKEALDNGKEVNAFTYMRVYEYTIYNAIKNGTPLPKGHGRLIDVDELEGHRQIQIVPCGNGKYVEIMTYHQNDIDVAPTIIEADKEGEERK